MTQVPADVSAKADQIRSGLAHQTEQIESNDDLTPQARQRLLNEARATAKESMSELRDSWRGRAEASANASVSDLFGHGSGYAGTDAISSRDAQDRASRLETQSDALDLLSRAQLTGDEVLAGAVVAEAWRRSQANMFGHGWLHVLDAYAAGDASRAAKVAKLRASARQTDRSFDLQTVATFSI